MLNARTPPSSPRVPVAPGAPSRPRTRGILRPSAPRYPAGQLILEGDQVMISAPGNTRERGVVLEVTEPRITIRVDGESLSYEPESLRLESRGDGVRYENGQLVKPGDRVRVNDKPGVVLEIGFRAEVFVHMEEENTKKKWQVSELKFIERESEQTYTDEQVIKRGDKVQINNLLGDMDGAQGMVTFIGSKITVRTSETQWSLWEPEKLILIERFNPQKGDIWVRVSDVFSVPAIIVIAGYTDRLVEYYGISPEYTIDMDRERQNTAPFVIKNFVFKERGIRVGDVRKNTVTGRKVKITKVDLSVAGSVEFYYIRDGENTRGWSLAYGTAMRQMPLEGDDHPLTNFFPKEPKIGDIWKEGNKRVLLIGVGSIMKYYILTDTNGIYSSSPDTLFREDFLQRYSFHQTGPHVGDMWIGGEKVTITEVDYSLPITVFVQPFTTVRSFGLPFKQIMNTFQIESDGPSDDARLDQWTVWEQKNNSKKYVVTNVNKPKLTYVSTTMNTPMTMPIKQFLKEFAYSQDGPMVGQKWLKIGEDFEFVQISQLKPEHLIVYKQGDLDVKGTVSWEKLLDDYIPQPELKRTQLWARRVANTPSWEIRQVDALTGSEVKLKALTTIAQSFITPQLDNFKREWIYYSELPTTGQVWKYKTLRGNGIEVIVRHISTIGIPNVVYFSEVGQGGRNFKDLKDFLGLYSSIDSGFPVVLPKRNELWKHGESEERVKVTMFINATEATGPVVHFQGVGMSNTLSYRLEEFLQGYVPVDAIIPKGGDAYQNIKTEKIVSVQMVYSRAHIVTVFTTAHKQYEIQTWLRDFIPYETGEAKAEALFPTQDLKTLMEKNKDRDLKGTDTILQFSIWLMELEKTTEEHVKMLGYLIEMGAAVHWTGEDIAPLEALYRIKLNEHVATMMIMMVKAGADAWANEKSSLVYALLKKRSPLAGKVLVDIINIGINTDDFYQLCMIPGRGDNPMGNLPGVMTAYFLEDGKLKEPFSDPNQEIKGNFVRGKISRLHKLIASYANAKRFKLRLQDIESVLDAHIYHPKLKLKKADIEGWFEAALATRRRLGEKRMDHLWGLFKKNRTSDKEFYLLKLQMEGGEIDEFIYVMESLKVDVNITSKKRTLVHILATMELHEGELEIFVYLVTNSKYDPNILDKEGYTAVGRLLHDNPMVDMEVYLGCVRLLLLLPQLNPNVISGKWTYLQYLCKTPAYKDIMKAYLKREDVDVNAKSVAGQTAMHIARYPAAWELLYSTGKVDLNAIDDKGRSILQLAADGDEEEKIKWLLSKEGEGLDTSGIINYVVNNERNPMPLLEVWGPSKMLTRYNILFVVHRLLRFDQILKIIDRDDFQPNLTDGLGNTYLTLIVLSDGRDKLSSDRRIALIKLLLFKGVDDRKGAIEAARNRGLQDIVNLLISPREHKVKDLQKKKRLELDKCSDYKKRVEKMDAEIEALNKLTDKEFEEKIGKAQMSKCQNEMDLITLAPWEALDYKNTLFLRVTDLQGKQRTYCLVKKFYKGESYTLNGKKYEEPDEQTTISQYIKKIRYADWVYAYDVGSHKKGRAYSKEDVYSKSGEDGKPGNNRYVVFTPSDGTTYYVKHDKTLKKLIKMKEQRIQSDNYANGYYTINGTSFELPKDWSLPLAIYVTAVKKLAIGNEAGSSGSSESHGNVMVMTYKVDRIVNFNSYDSIDEERECLGKCPKQPKLRF